MKTKHNILFACFLILSLNVFGQNLRILNTKDLIEISEKQGLDSALKMGGTLPYYSGEIPLFYTLDEVTTEELIKQIKNNKPANRTETFLVTYALCVRNIEAAAILYDYFDRMKDELIDYNPAPERNFALSKMSKYSLFALVENPLENTDSLLFKYYELWNQKVNFYLQYYQQGLEEKDKYKQEILVNPYEICHYSCYILQRFLKQMESPLYDQEKMEYHQNFVSGFAVKKDIQCSEFKKNNIFKTIKLSKNYNSIGEINLEKELKWEKLIQHYNKSYCKGFLMFNEKIGYLSLSCYFNEFESYDVKYQLELKENKLIIYRISRCIS